jgi:DNA-binding CsgD family transcriptional regulator/DNA-binding Xre family transcriptional regulator
MTAPVQVGPSPSGGGPGPSSQWDEALADVADRIRAERKARGWSQTEMARQAGISKSTVHRLESDVSVVVRHLLQACEALGVPPAHLLSDQWQMPARRPALSPRQVDVLREVMSGDSLTCVGDRLGMSSQAVSSVLNRVYQRLDVAHIPVGERRAAAARAAMQHGLFTASNRTS